MIKDAEVDKILAMGWEAAARRNSMRLVSSPPDALQQLREMVRDSLSKGISAVAICEHIPKELIAADRTDADFSSDSG